MSTTAEQQQAVEAIVREADRLQSDVEGFVALLTDDAAIVNFVGRRVAGRKQIRKVMGRALASPLAQVRTRTEIVDVRFPAPGVALVNAVKHVSDGRSDAEPLGADRGNMTFVLVERDGVWKIALAQTTPIVA
ncbi:SgcJ/EcaC family oxidoreductase [Conexibacter arvalis]|uniref:Uncharacterized protein (TIGR02246 family) n=1 Tax=Conexibacter arvalis TaxID=912552 RepID=A0A840I975_9ACTN|nr:SgcJ/EcaC family oxidoreductase [Conexibacter arvalis]MBB4660490.1 uncharacterized protein (TIGR02246 family) [Conexibacter arvalis]